jgi:hypothetical protein
MSDNSKLTLEQPEFNARVQNFFNLMTVGDFQKKFFENPALVASEELGFRSLPATQLSNANKMVHHLLSDAKFNEWAKGFQATIEKDFPDLSKLKTIKEITALARVKANQEKFKKEFADSVVKHLSPGAYNQIVERGVVQGGLINAEGDVAIVLLTFVAVIVIVVIAAGIGRPTEALSRINLNLLVNQISKEAQTISLNSRE